MAKINKTLNITLSDEDLHEAVYLWSVKNRHIDPSHPRAHTAVKLAVKERCVGVGMNEHREPYAEVNITATWP